MEQRKCPWYCIRLTPYAVLVIVECNVLQGSITQSANEKDDLAANCNHTVLRIMQRANEENRIETLRGEGKKHLELRTSGGVHVQGKDEIIWHSLTHWPYFVFMDHIWARSPPQDWAWCGMPSSDQAGWFCTPTKIETVQFFNVLCALYIRHYDSLGFSVTCKTAWMPGVSTSSRRLLWEYSQKLTRTAKTVESLCIFLWSKLCYSFDALRPSKSEKITGFYDVLIGCLVILVEQRHARDIPILDNWTTFALIVCDSSYMKYMKYMTPHSCKHTVSVALACIGMHWHVLLSIQAPSINHPSVHLSIHPSIYPSSVHLWI